jgi:hypothetical protein
MSRPLPTWLRASMGFAPPTNGSPSIEMIRSSVLRNEASDSFHRSLGFQDAGLYRRAAWRRDCRHDVASMQLDLLDTADPDGRPGPLADRGPAPSGPLRNRQGAMPARTGFAKVNRGRVVHLRYTFTPENTLRQT